MKFARSAVPPIACVVVLSRPSPVKAQQWTCDVSPSAPCTALGNVGIGTTNPAASLEIAGTQITALRINGTIGNTGSNNTQFRFAGGTRVTFGHSGPI